jgi:hypothetical protein
MQNLIIEELLREKVAAGLWEFSRHALDQSIQRYIQVAELREALLSGRVIESYPDDKYGPSCLILGFSNSQRPLHVHCSYPSRPLVKIITVYEPDPLRWIEWRIRR